MKLSTKSSIFGKLMDLLNINNNFSKITKYNFDKNKEMVISPVEAKVVKVGNIDNKGNFISKGNKKVNLKYIIGSKSKLFSNYKYINLYLSPKNKHFWITPYEGSFTYTQKNEGKGLIPTLIAIENITNVPVFHRAIRRNATIASILEVSYNSTKFPILLVAVGSLNVNRIHINYDENKKYVRGKPIGHFSLGSSFLLIYPKNLEVLVKENQDVKMGQGLLRIKNSKKIK